MIGLLEVYPTGTVPQFRNLGEVQVVGADRAHGPMGQKVPEHAAHGNLALGAVGAAQDFIQEEQHPASHGLGGAGCVDHFLQAFQFRHVLRHTPGQGVLNPHAGGNR